MHSTLCILTESNSDNDESDDGDSEDGTSMPGLVAKNEDDESSIDSNEDPQDDIDWDPEELIPES